LPLTPAVIAAALLACVRRSLCPAPSLDRAGTPVEAQYQTADAS
jgi:hypothetical protein